MTFSATPTVDHSPRPSLVETRTRVVELGAVRALQDADLVVDQLQLGELRVDPLQAHAQRPVQRVDRAVALGGGDDPLALGPQLHGRLVGVRAVGAVLDDRPPGLDAGSSARAPALGPRRAAAARRRRRRPRTCSPCSSRSLTRSTTRPTSSRSPPRSMPSSLPLSSMEARPGHVGDQHPHGVADQLGVDVLVEVGVDLDRGGVQSGLVGEGGDTHVGLVGGGREVDDLGDGVRDPGHLGERALGQHLACRT